MLGTDFSSLNRKYEIGKPGQGFGGGFKKLSSMNFAAAQNEPVDDCSGGGDYLVAPEYKSEIVY